MISPSRDTDIPIFDIRICVIVGFLDSIVAAKQNAGIYGYSISPNRELVALGASNLVASLIPGTLPAYGSITRCALLSPHSALRGADVGAVQVARERRRGRAHTDGVARVLGVRPPRDLRAPAVAVLPPEMRASVRVRASLPPCLSAPC